MCRGRKISKLWSGSADKVGYEEQYTGHIENREEGYARFAFSLVEKGQLFQASLTLHRSAGALERGWRGGKRRSFHVKKEKIVQLEMIDTGGGHDLQAPPQGSEDSIAYASAV